MLIDCLDSIQSGSSELPRVILIDNHSTDDSITQATKKFPWVDVISSKQNLGYAGGCNLGISNTKTPYVMLLNNDVIIQKDCFEILISKITTNPKIAAVQPTIKSYYNQNMFDYAGAAGGLIDRDGIPFAYGRILNTIEEDKGQYLNIKEIFWSSGTASLFRMDALHEVGLLYEPFFAHQEEIDLCWRLLAYGWEIVAEPKVVIFHRGGATLNRSSNFKLYLNHRNNLWMWVRNIENLTVYSVSRRLVLEFLAFLAYLCRGDLGRILHQIKSWRDFLKRLPVVYQERQQIQKRRKVSDKHMKGMFQKSVIFEYYFRRRRYTSQFFNIN